MSSDVKIWFSDLELGLLGAAKVIPGMKRYERGAREEANRLKWQQRSVECMGGKHGLRTEYRPPADALALIHTFLQADPDFFGKSKARTRADLAALSKATFGDAPLRIAQNSNLEYEAALKRIADATQATVRVSKLFDGALPVEWTSLIQELMAMHGLSEVGAKRVIEALKHQT